MVINPKSPTGDTNVQTCLFILKDLQGTEYNEAELLATLNALEKPLIKICFVSNSRPPLTEDYHRPPGKKILT